MAGAPTPAGFLYFTAVKAAGYTAASVVLKIGYGLRGAPKPSVWALGLTRTGIGLAAGALYGCLWILALNKFNTFEGEGSAALFYLFLLPIRLGGVDSPDLALPRPWAPPARACGNMPPSGRYVPTLWTQSAWAAFVLPGGLWVC
jgi:hypothetical protein